MRVDLYYADGQIYFDELTYSPDNGLKPFDPVGYDHIFGEYLDLNNYYKYCLLNRKQQTLSNHEM